jgi:DNA-binding NarL/FixJ family response regulator
MPPWRERTMVVLLVDDDPIVALAVAVELEAAGHEVLGPAHDARSALELARTGRPDVALVDIDLGEGGDGVLLAHSLRRSGVWPVFATGESGRAREHRDIAMAFLSKPYRPEAAVRSLEAVQAALKGLRPDCPPELEWFGAGGRAGGRRH